MKRNDLLAATLVFAVALGINPVLRGADPVPQCPACSAKETSKTQTVKATKEKLVQELIAILNETKSPDTFIVTASALGMMGHDARPAVPSIIRNADRLGLLKGISELAGEESEEAKPTRQQRIAEGIMDCLDQILSKQPSNGGKTANPPAVPLVCPPSGIILPECLPFPVCPPPAPKAPKALDADSTTSKTPSENTQVFSFFIGSVR
jgi:hypothetical protein